MGIGFDEQRAGEFDRLHATGLAELVPVCRIDHPEDLTGALT